MTHDGHRKRLKNRFLNSPESFEDHELLELILFYAIPRKNTNETAHKLLNRFGSIKGILDASTEALCEIDDIGPNSALYIKAIASLLLRYENSDIKSDGLLKSPVALSSFLKNLFIGTENEISYILLFDNSKRLITCEKIGEGFSLEHTLSLRKITSCALSSNAVSAILVHNHPNGKAFPSGEDIHATNRIRLLLEPLGITLMEHFIVAGEECLPIINSQSAHRFNGKDC
jgi:DNA repair protein RadC